MRATEFIPMDGVMERIEQFVQGAQVKVDEIYKDRIGSATRKLAAWVFEPAKQKTRYCKVFANDYGSKHGSVWAFIDLTNGDIYKPASSKAPAKHARGNVFAEDYGLSCVTAYGPEYLR